MIISRHFLYFIFLGLFWGLSQSLYKAMAMQNMPISHVIVYAGFGVGLGLMVAARISGTRLDFGREVLVFGLGCAILLNIPFAIGLYLIRHLPATEMALIVSTAPFFNYVIALATGRENAVPRRLLAVAAGFVSSAILILSREGVLSGQISWWTLAAFSSPILYTAYNWFAAHFWPKDRDVYSIGASESFWSGLLAVPFMLYYAAPWGPATPELFAYWTVLVAGILWIIERIAFFTLIRDKGAVYTIQAVYVSTPAAVLFAILFYGGGTDFWLWISLAILMLALWLNNTGSSVRPLAATQPSS
jgi:drug/metabolite transporter (DMT)-like permease